MKNSNDRKMKPILSVNGNDENENEEAENNGEESNNHQTMRKWNESENDKENQWKLKYRKLSVMKYEKKQESSNKYKSKTMKMK